MARNTTAPVQNLDRSVGDARLDGRTDQPRWNRVVVLPELDVIVGRDHALLPFGIAVRSLGSALSAGRSIVSSSSARLLPILRITLALRSLTHSRMAVLSSTSEKNRRLRSRARTKRWTIWTATSTLALSRGLRTRAGSTTNS